MIDELSPEAEADMVEYYLGKTKRPGDWYAKQIQMITGMGDFSEADYGEAPKGAVWN